MWRHVSFDYLQVLGTLNLLFDMYMMIYIYIYMIYYCTYIGYIYDVLSYYSRANRLPLQVTGNRSPVTVVCLSVDA